MRDVVVIGSGGGGAVVAKELAAVGLDVLVLEAGPHFTDPEAQWSRYENDADNPISGYLRFGPADRSKPPWLRELAQSAILQQTAGVGGSTLHYFGNSPRSMPGVFAGYAGADREAYDHAHAFPFRYEDLIPYYEWVEETLPVQTAAMGTKEAVFFEAAARVGLPPNRRKDVIRDSFRPQENAILQPQGTAGRTTDPRKLLYPQARGCTFCGHCAQGCIQPRRAPRNLRAKRSTDTSYIPMALTADRWARGGRAITLRPDAFVTRILFEEVGGRAVARGVRWRDVQTGERLEERAHVVVLAGGCVEDPRLWLNSGLPDPNGWVGRGFTNHAMDCVIGRLGRYTGTSKGPHSAARVDYPGRGMLEHTGVGPVLMTSFSQLSDSGIRGFYSNGRGATGSWDGRAGRLTGPEMKEFFSDIDRLLCVLVFTDDDVEPHNRVLRSSFPADENGPVPKVTFPRGRRSARTHANREFLADQAVRIVRAAGADRVYRMDWPAMLFHLQSTMRMGHDERNSVISESGEARFVERLFITDNAALPNGLGGVNPTLTTQALATRTAERLVAKYFGGDGFVQRGTPVRSTDDRVTQALLDCEVGPAARLHERP